MDAGVKQPLERVVEKSSAVVHSLRSKSSTIVLAMIRTNYARKDLLRLQNLQLDQ